MMLPTHALGGMLLALPVALFVPGLAEPALVGGLLGGVFPDLDLYAGHRKTLHFPVYFSGLAAVAVAVAAYAPTVASVGVAFFLLGAAVHSVSDAFGGGLELRPWEATSDRAVYDHYRGRWIAPTRWIRYDGAPEDLLLSGVFAAPLVVHLEGILRWVVLAFLAIGVVYTAVRRLLPAVAGRLLRVLPAEVLVHLPARFVRDLEECERSIGVSDGR